MKSGCGLSRKHNKKADTIFLYFWRYEEGQKLEQYLGRADDPSAETKGLQLMLSFYRLQDEDLHQRIRRIEAQLVARSRIEKPEPSRPDYLPETEE
ncbi:MAG: hypothetical protein A3K61_04825 [Thaumarchaeota archaeon RBG_16_49_8]|nr:MAG: hypothetical protein A3K61_04825 [Thaumarchaeota archaeon RBG_16_49_8]